MKQWTWRLVTVVGALLLGICIMFFRTTEPAVQSTLLDWLYRIACFVVGTGAGGIVGVGLGFARRLDPDSANRLVDWTWPLVVAVALLVVFISLMFGESLNHEIRTRLLSYFESVLPFVVGSGVGGATGRTLALRRE